MNIKPGTVVAVDFDGTMVRHEYPGIGPALDGAVETVAWLQSLGVKVALWTMRSGKELDEAVAWMAARGIRPDAVNTNPAQAKWTQSPKLYAHRYIDDAAIGCPLDGKGGVDWPIVRGHLEAWLGGGS